MLRPKRRQRLRDNRALDLPRALLGGTGGQLTAVRDEQPVQFGRLDHFAVTLPHRHPSRPVPRDRTQPAREPGRLLQLRQRFEGQQECLLRDVLGGRPRPEDLFGDQSHRAAEPAHEFIERFQVTEQCGEDERLVADMRVVAFAHHRSPCSC